MSHSLNKLSTSLPDDDDDDDEDGACGPASQVEIADSPGARLVCVVVALHPRRRRRRRRN